MWNLRTLTFHLLLLWSSSSVHYHAIAYPSHNYDILKAECIERTQRDFNNNIIAKRKEMKITVNGKQLGYYGFENSANAVILLDVSNTNVQLPKMNISFTNLIMLHASYNGLEKIDDIGNETFPSLKFLNLSHNAIANIKSHVFSHLREIEILDLSHNCLTHFNYDHVFVRHENLKKIYLHDNLLHKIHGTAGMNSHLLHLELMDLSRNFIEDFNNMNIQIMELKVTNNSLKTLNIHHADEMTLFARHNQITSFSSGSGKFKLVDLSHNEIKFLSQVEMRGAKVLRLAHNKIAALADDSSSSASDYDESEDVSDYNSVQRHDNVGFDVEIIDLSYNQLDTMKDLRYFKVATSINLEGNLLKNLDVEDIRRKFQKLNYINFINNPLTSIDVDEMRFHNDTRFLGMHIEYQAPTTLPTSITSTTQTPEIINSTTESQLNTTQSSMPTTSESATCREHNNIIMLKGENTVTANKIEWHNRQQYWAWIFGVFVIAGFIVSIIYNKHRNKTQMRYMNREFNDAENFL